ncbi:hypothetical protein T484DRAFT_1825083 [Baffinella frigidus]|nr:hypothetical protein T484DRAFT_1825083 [Cryptophyta sp. CCMP2293]
MSGEAYMEELDPLHAACEAGDTKAVIGLLEGDFLLEKYGEKAPGVNSVARFAAGTSKEGFTPIFYAALSGEPETCRVLVERGADPLFLDAMGYNCANYSKGMVVRQILRNEQIRADNLVEEYRGWLAKAGLLEAREMVVYDKLAEAAKAPPPGKTPPCCWIPLACSEWQKEEWEEEGEAGMYRRGESAPAVFPEGATGEGGTQAPSELLKVAAERVASESKATREPSRALESFKFQRQRSEDDDKLAKAAKMTSLRQWRGDSEWPEGVLGVAELISLLFEVLHFMIEEKDAQKVMLKMSSRPRHDALSAHDFQWPFQTFEASALVAAAEGRIDKVLAAAAEENTALALDLLSQEVVDAASVASERAERCRALDSKEQAAAKTRKPTKVTKKRGSVAAAPGASPGVGATPPGAASRAAGNAGPGVGAISSPVVHMDDLPLPEQIALATAAAKTRMAFLRNVDEAQAVVEQALFLQGSYFTRHLAADKLTEAKACATAAHEALKTARAPAQVVSLPCQAPAFEKASPKERQVPTITSFFFFFFFFFITIQPENE